MTTKVSKPLLPALGARSVAVPMLVYGALLAVPAARLAMLGGSPGFLLSAIGSAICAILLFLRRRSAPPLYGLVALGTVIWALTQVGPDPILLLPRIWPALLLGAFVLIVWLRREKIA